jgi:site-specific recombinase XerD
MDTKTNAGPTDVDLLIQGYSTYLRGLKKSPRTVIGYTDDAKRWARWWKRPVEFFGQDEWDDYTAFLEQRGLSGKSIRRHLCGLKRFYKYLRRRRVCENEPDKDCEPVGVKKSVPGFLLESEVNLLISSVKELRYRAMLELCYSCGLRNEECRQLKIYQVSDNHLQLYGKGNKERVITLAPQSKAILDLWLKERVSKTDLVFPSLHEGVIRQATLQHAFVRALKRAGITKPVTIHSLRHSIATHLAMRKVPVEAIQAFLGHNQIETTMVYIHLAKQLNQEALLRAHPRQGGTDGITPKYTISTEV